MSVAEAAVCPNCAEPVVPGDQFCEACGKDLPVEVAAAERPADAPPAQSPEHEAGYTEVVRPPAAACESCGGTFVDGWCDTCGAKEPDPRDHQEVDHGIAGAITSDKGLRYARNEDGFADHVAADLRVVVVCDGVGSTVDPEVASQTASRVALTRLVESPADHVAAHRAADDAVRDLDWTPRPEAGSPSCTYLAATVEGTTVRVASLGDCRAYWLPDDGDPVLVTVDDSWAQEQADLGAMTLEEAMADRRAHVITRWLGRDAQPDWEPELVELDASAGGLLLLCSDGFWNYAPDPDLVAEQVAKAGPDATPLEVSQHLVAHAIEQGGHDNVTVAVLPVPVPRAEPPTEPASTPEPASAAEATPAADPPPGDPTDPTDPDRSPAP